MTPDDLPDLRERLKTTRCGQEIWKNVQCWGRTQLTIARQGKDRPATLVDMNAEVPALKD